MITKQTRQQTVRNGGTIGWLARSALGLAASTLLILLALVVSQPTQISGLSTSDLWSDARAMVDQLAVRIGLSESVTPASMHSYPLGIDLPYEADVRDLPRGLTDYLRPSDHNTTAAMQSHPLGIDLPQGADARELPRGLTDYLRPETEHVSVSAPSNVPGITMPTGTQRSDLPRGMTDYLRANQ